MFGNQVEEKFANSISQASVASRGRDYWPIIILLNVAIVLFLVWAANSEIEEVTSGSGRVIPSSQVQVIQSLEGGIVASISVKEGDVVEANQVLMQIEDRKSVV